MYSSYLYYIEVPSIILWISAHYWIGAYVRAHNVSLFTCPCRPHSHH